MDLPAPESMQAYLERLALRNREVAISFVLVELTTGLSSCQQIRDSKSMTYERKAWHLAHAGKALEIAETAMWKLKMAHPEFDQMMALAERLKFEVQTLQTT
jgi:hypothetical protein